MKSRRGTTRGSLGRVGNEQKRVEGGRGVEEKRERNKKEKKKGVEKSIESRNGRQVGEEQEGGGGEGV